MCHTITVDEITVVRELVRLGLRGESSSVRRFTRRIVRERVSEFGPKDPLYITLSAELETAATPSRARRRVSPGGFFTNSELVRVVDVDAAPLPILESSVADELHHIVQERNQLETLRHWGLEPSRSVLFTGPPGVGKTMAAASLARQLDLPLLTIDLGYLMSSHLGKSGQNLKEALRAAQEEPCVFFLDEFDSVAKSRSDLSDVGELKRLVNLLLVELDSWKSSSLLVAATNRASSLDDAVWRRFDRVISFKLPSLDVRLAILDEEVRSFQPRTPSKKSLLALASTTRGMTGADISRLVKNAARGAALSGEQFLPLLELSALAHLRATLATNDGGRDTFCEIASRDLGWTQRRIGDELGISHVAVGKILKKRKNDGR